MNVFSDQEPTDGGQSSIAGHLRSVANDDALKELDDAAQKRLARSVEKMNQAAQQKFFAHVGRFNGAQLLAISEGADLDLFCANDDATPRSYTVRPHDSLSKIAKKHKVSLADLIAANPQIKNPDLIYPDQVIKLPST